MVSHKSDYNKFLKGKGRYITSFSILEKNNYTITLLEEVNCNTKDQLHAREAHYIKTIQCVNKHIPNRSFREWQIENRDKINQQSRHRRNDEEPTKCDCGGSYKMNHKHRHFNTTKHQTFMNNQI